MEATQAKAQAQPNDANRAAAQDFNTKMSEWRRTQARPSLEEIPADGFRRLLHDNTPGNIFSVEQTADLQKLADQIADLFDSSRQKGGYTAEAADFYDKYYDGLGAALYKSAFSKQ